MSDIKVRFAPSPTGFLHLGGLRTALFNYLYARSKGGNFILRIEDTDRSRMVEGAIDNLLEIFNWLGIEFDEGPHTGGENGPYIQSERLHIYREYIDKLLKRGYAYRCFCSPERLETVRREQSADKKTPMYDRLCRDIPEAESSSRAENEPYVVRLKVPLEGVVCVIDGVRGKIEFNVTEIDDQVLLKTDGFPTYHLANVVDDHLMGVTDVIRGEEWLTSTPKHVLLYKRFGWKPSNFFHLPLLLNQDRSKLSKRQGDVAVEDYRAKGYLPQALINYTALLGWHPADNREFFTIEELIREFSLDRVSKTGAVFDIDKLNWLNRRHLSDLSDEEFLRSASEYLPDGFDFTSEIGVKILEIIREKTSFFSEIESHIKPFTGNRALPREGEVYDIITAESSRNLFAAILKRLETVEDWNPEIFKEIMKAAGKESGVKGKNLWMPVRAALTGETHGPDMGLIAEALGVEKIKALMEETLCAD